jgi:hypothetical protein
MSLRARLLQCVLYVCAFLVSGTEAKAHCLLQALGAATIEVQRMAIDTYDSITFFGT